MQNKFRTFSALTSVLKVVEGITHTAYSVGWETIKSGREGIYYEREGERERERGRESKRGERKRVFMFACI